MKLSNKVNIVNIVNFVEPLAARMSNDVFTILSVFSVLGKFTW